MTTSADNRKSHSSGWLFCIAALAIAALAGCSEGQPEAVNLSGPTMGTTWNVTYIPAPEAGMDEVSLRNRIQAELDAVDASMSTYLPDSELSRLNELDPASEWTVLSAPLYKVMEAALAIGAASEGAYDVTVAPLVDLWGFGPEGPVSGVPAEADIQSALALVGQRYISLNRANWGFRKHRAVRVDLSSIAKGYAVDRVAGALADAGIANYLVEVGGEMRLAGQSPRGDLWRIAIEQPSAGARTPARAVSLTDVAVATSGDYRNFFEMDGKRYSHSIDPRSAYPVAHDLVSVTVLAESAMLADGWATALEVLGAEDAMRIATEQQLAVYFIRRVGEQFVASSTPAFRPYLASDSSVK